MTIRDDALLLAGYALGARESLPSVLQQAVDRLIASADDHIPEPTKMVVTVPPVRLPDVEIPLTDTPESPTSEPGSQSDAAPAEPEKKKRKEWSPEAKEAARQRMLQRIAEGKIKPYTSKKQPPAAPPHKDIDPDKLIQDHADYAGEREDRTLVDTDWGDIQRMRYNGLPDARIAKSYRVELDYLQRFIERMEKQEEQKVGNF